MIGCCENGICQNHRADFDLANEELYIQQLRIFNTSSELLVRRMSKGLYGRLRQDGDGNVTDVVVAHQALFGTWEDEDATIKEGFSKITERRGTSLIVPFTDLPFKNKRRVCMKTHNYVCCNEFGQAAYADSRFVGFTDGQNDLERRDA